jgi:iron(III) transport system substrate-binding protein
LVYSAYVKAPFIYNPNLISPREIQSWKDLLNPKWKGRIVLRDPTGAGGGLGSATFWYTHEALGKDFIRQLFMQDIAFARDDRQMLDFTAKGKYPIAIGPSDTLANEFVAKGLPLKHMNPAALREGTYITAGNGTLVIMRNPPHPNALKVYLDYFLSKEGQANWSKAAGFASLRRDVPNDHVPDAFVPKEGMDYPELHKERYLKLREEIVNFVKTIMPR